MGGAGRAAVEAAEVGLLNPASFVSVTGYNMAAEMRDFSTKDGGSTGNVLLHASENSGESLFPLAITYLKTRDSNAAISGVREDFHLTTGQVIFSNVAFGLDVGKYTNTPAAGIEDSEWDIKMGFLFVPLKDWGFGLVFSNLLDTDSVYLKRTLEGGVNYLFNNFFRMSFDVTYQTEDNPEHDGVVMLGIEHLFMKQIPLRLGMKWDDPIDENYWTLGLAWKAPRIGFGYTFEKNVAENKEYGHSFDLKIYF